METNEKKLDKMAEHVTQRTEYMKWYIKNNIFGKRLGKKDNWTCVRTRVKQVSQK